MIPCAVRTGHGCRSEHPVNNRTFNWTKKAARTPQDSIARVQTDGDDRHHAVPAVWYRGDVHGGAR